ncbi:hypothetical protein WJX74_007671 [Apatococcus lobatus]|uniref:RNA helicase n=2 Tax=Apatococcus TaxID=904362 RepID=A0AAW1T617_9CHLO
MAKDFNPGFSFDFGAPQESRRPSWGLAGSASKAQLQLGAAANTTLDHKISQRLAAKRKRQPAAVQEHEIADGLAEEPSSSDSEDAPLPGEMDDDDDDDSQDSALIGSEPDSALSSGDVHSLPAEPSEVDSDEDHGSDPGSDVALELQGEPTTTHLQPAGSMQKSKTTAKRQLADVEQSAAKRSRQATADAGVKQAKPGGTTGFFAQTPDGTSFTAGSFSDLHLSRPLLRACTALGYTRPTPIQAACIPLALTGRDICGSAVTGSGKTAAFVLPLLERLLFRSRRISATYVLILTPTRELAVQVHDMTEKLAQFTDIRAALVVGGMSLTIQASTLRSRPEIVIGTPGRMIDHLRNTQSFGLEDLQGLVLDEADRLLAMGFADEVKEIVKLAPRKRQTMLFSATMTEQVKQLATMSLQQPVRLAADALAAAPRELTQELVRLKGAAAADKEAVLLALCSRSFSAGRTIVFFRTKHQAHRVKMLFGLAGLPSAAELHGNMTQAARLESLDRFRKGDAAFLLATDVAARGLDIQGVQAVINYDAARTLDSHLHRIGRTARAGHSGRAVTLAEDADRPLIKEVVKKTGAQLQNRLVPQPSIVHWRNRIEAMSPDIDRLRLEEREERDLRKAEMEANKAENMMEHEAEIYSRPARTWFQTERQKKQVANRARDAVATGAEDDEEEEEEGGRPKQGQKGPQAAKQQRRAAAKEQRRLQAAGQGDGSQPAKHKNAFMEETQQSLRLARAAKSRESKLRQEGMDPTQASRAAAAAAAKARGVQPKKKDKNKKGSNNDSLFDGDGTGRPGPDASGVPLKGGVSKVYAGGPKSGKLRLPTTGPSKQELNKTKRGGKGKKSFKSKARHKRK